jgi:hypothetical protein
MLLRARIAPPERRPPAAARDHDAMDIERINSIGTLLADLAARTQQLRGYL